MYAAACSVGVVTQASVHGARGYMPWVVSAESSAAQHAQRIHVAASTAKLQLRAAPTSCMHSMPRKRRKGRRARHSMKTTGPHAYQRTNKSTQPHLYILRHPQQPSNAVRVQHDGVRLQFIQQPCHLTLLALTLGGKGVGNIRVKVGLAGTCKKQCRIFGCMPGIIACMRPSHTQRMQCRRRSPCTACPASSWLAAYRLCTRCTVHSMEQSSR